MNVTPLDTLWAKYLDEIKVHDDAIKELKQKLELLSKIQEDYRVFTPCSTPQEKQEKGPQPKGTP